MPEQIGFRVEMVPVNGGVKEGRLVANGSQEATNRFVRGVFHRFGQPRPEPKRGEAAEQTGEEAASR